MKPRKNYMCAKITFLFLVYFLCTSHLFYISITRLYEEIHCEDCDIFENISEVESWHDAESGFREQIANIEQIISIRNTISRFNEITRKIKIKDKINEIVPLVIVVQVHDRIIYLEELLKSLQKVVGIMRTILIFSHDCYDEDINLLIRHIHWAPVIQIYYPYSIQLNPNIFPGDDKNYCTEGWKCDKSKVHLRNAKLAQLKHHWWWKVNYVFDHVAILRKYDGPVVFLEDDQFVTEDFLYVLLVMNVARKQVCKECALNLGAYPPLLSKYNLNSSLIIEEFGATPAHMGLAFDRRVWNRLKKLSHHFCHYNSYDWTASLRFSTSRLPKGSLDMLAIAGSRVIHIGKCGINREAEDCDITDKMKRIKYFMELIHDRLYPKDFSLIRKSRYSPLEEIGYFSDVRDQELCMYFSKEY